VVADRGARYREALVKEHVRGFPTGRTGSQREEVILSTLMQVRRVMPPKRFHRFHVEAFDLLYCSQVQDEAAKYFREFRIPLIPVVPAVKNMKFVSKMTLLHNCRKLAIGRQ